MNNINNSTKITLSDIAAITDTNPLASKAGSVAGRKIDAINYGILGCFATKLTAMGVIISGIALTSLGLDKLGIRFIGGGITTVVGGAAIAGGLAYRGYVRKLSKKQVTDLIGPAGKIALDETNKQIDDYVRCCNEKRDILMKQAASTASTTEKLRLTSAARSWHQKTVIAEEQRKYYANVIGEMVMETQCSEQAGTEVPYPVFIFPGSQVNTAYPRFIFTTPPPTGDAGNVRK